MGLGEGGFVEGGMVVDFGLGGGGVEGVELGGAEGVVGDEEVVEGGVEQELGGGRGEGDLGSFLAGHQGGVVD